jgi:hypothetical protein
MKHHPSPHPCFRLIGTGVLSLMALAWAAHGFAAQAERNVSCQATSAAHITPVLELYTSEGCSSCPPADRWLSSFKTQARQGQVVAMAFHVGYWDHIGWVDRFAAPAYTQRQRQQAQRLGLRNVYTPQMLLSGSDWPQWRRTPVASFANNREKAEVAIHMQGQQDNGLSVRALVSPLPDKQRAWSGFWALTEDGHSSRVGAGENAGEHLQHDFVVRGFEPLPVLTGTQSLRLSVSKTPLPHGVTQRVNLVVTDPESGKILQALALICV